MALTRDFKKTVVARMQREPKFVRALLDEALMQFLGGDPETAKLLLRDLISATMGFESLAANVGKPSKSLHRMLSKSGNPTMENLSAILVAMQEMLRVDIKTVVKAA